MVGLGLLNTTYLTHTTKAISAIPGCSVQGGIAGLFLAILIVLECYAWGKDKENLGWAIALFPSINHLNFTL